MRKLCYFLFFAALCGAIVPSLARPDVWSDYQLYSDYFEDQNDKENSDVDYYGIEQNMNHDYQIEDNRHWLKNQEDIDQVVDKSETENEKEVRSQEDVKTDLASSEKDLENFDNLLSDIKDQLAEPKSEESEATKEFTEQNMSQENPERIEDDLDNIEDLFADINSQLDVSKSGNSEVNNEFAEENPDDVRADPELFEEDADDIDKLLSEIESQLDDSESKIDPKFFEEDTSGENVGKAKIDSDSVKWAIGDSVSMPLNPVGIVDENGNLVIKDKSDTKNDDAPEKNMNQGDSTEILESENDGEILKWIFEDEPISSDDTEKEVPEENLEINSNDDEETMSKEKVEDHIFSENVLDNLIETDQVEEFKGDSIPLNDNDDDAESLDTFKENTENKTDDEVKTMSQEKEDGRDILENKFDDDVVPLNSVEKIDDTENLDVEENSDTRHGDNERDHIILEDVQEDDIENSELDQAYEDLDEDIDKLLNTWKKLSDLSEGEEQNVDDSSNVSDYEDKFGRPFRESNILVQRDYNYENDDYDEDLDTVLNKSNDEEKETIDDDDKIFNEQAAIDENNSVLSEIDQLFDQHKNSVASVDDSLEMPEPIDTEETVDVADRIFDEKLPMMSDTFESVKSDSADTNLEPLSDNNSEKYDPQERLRYINDDTDNIETDDKLIERSSYDNVMEQFKSEHSEELDVSSDQFARDVAPIYLNIFLDEPTEVTSPDWPSPYPTDNTIDWILEGEGLGIELNITDFFVNGYNGDYLLIKPGGVDASGQDGLVFSYNLDTERRFRFLDVDRMFVRFHAGAGWPFRPGFRFSVKMILPLEEEVEESLPEPEPVLPAPETFSLYLGGITLPEFEDLIEDFRKIIVDMANMYIKANNIDPGYNSTSDVTQISRVAVCNIQWPQHELCAHVTFAVPLVYDEDQSPRLTQEDMSEMWNTYSVQDPFALRLNRMGIKEFSVPNDGRMLTMWLLLGAGGLVSMCMLAIALWRYNCVENYSRMPQTTEQDYVYNEKAGLDLYPTPHQTLPPLFENEYKWDEGKLEDSTRVDMGFTNKTFTRDDLFDIESDEEAISPRDRYTTDV